MAAFIRRLLARIELRRFRLAGIGAVHGYGDMVIDSAQSGRHTQGY